jgi:hypothetical protein
MKLRTLDTRVKDLDIGIGTEELGMTGEPLMPVRIVAALCVLAGAVLLRLA